MYLKSKFNFRKFLIALLSTLMAVMLAFSVACSDPDAGDDDDGEDNPSSSTTTQVTDYQIIKNGDFEFGWTDKTTFPLSSSINWSKTMGNDVTQATSSKGSSGIIDTGDKFDSISSKNKPKENPGTPFSKGLIANSDYDYDDEDKRVNPQVDGKKILMINNQNDGFGTAQSYKASSSMTVNVDEFALLTLWIKTVDIKSAYPSNTNPGAYVRLASSSGSNANDDFYVRGIDTKGEWAELKIAMKGSSLTSTSVTLHIGLGEGNGTDQNDFVEGFTFIDNVSYKTITEEEYVSTSNKEIQTENFKSESANLPSSYKKNDTVSENLTDKYSTISAKLDFTHAIATAKLSGSVQYSTAKPGYDYITGNTINVGTLEQAKAVVPSAFGEKDSFGEVVYMNFTKHSSAKFVTDTVTIKKGEYKYITFFAKVNASNANSNKLTVDVIDKIANITDQETVAFADIETSGLENERYNNWIKYQIFVNNPTDKDTSFELKFTFGLDKDHYDAYALQTGYALIADLSIGDVDEETYSLASAGEQVSKKQVYGEYISYSKVTEAETGNDVYGISVDKSQTFTLKNRPATNVSGFNFKSTKATTTYGIINSKYYNDSTNVYGTATSFSNDLAGLNNLKTTGNKYAQVILMDNTEAAYSRFVTTSYTVTADSYTKISVKVKAYGNAVANVSLVSSSIDADSREYEVMNFKLGEFSQALTSKVTSTSYQKDGWTTVHFYVHSGNEDIELRVMVSNGDAQTASQGVVLFDGVTYANVDAAKLQADKNSLKLNFGQYAEGLADNLKAEYAFTSKMDTRKPATVKTDGTDGEVIETIQYFNPTEVYLGNAYAKFVSYETINADDVIDNTTPDTDTDTPTTEEEGFTVPLDVTLQISSIIIAIVLIGVIVTILIRDALKKRAKRKQKTQAYYEETSGFDRNTREKTLKKIAEKKAKIALASDDEEYDYNAAEQVEEELEDEEVIIDDVVENPEQPEVTEETAEEATEETTEESSDNE